MLLGLVACAHSPPAQKADPEPTLAIVESPKKASLPLKAKPPAKKKKRVKQSRSKARRQRMVKIMRRFQDLSPVDLSDRQARVPLPENRREIWQELLTHAGAWAAKTRGARDQRFASRLAHWLSDQLALEERHYRLPRVLEDNAEEMIRFCEGRGLVESIRPKGLDRPLIWPLDDVVLTSFFGRRKNPFGRGHRNHDGIDLAAAEGSPVFAVAAGRVLRARTVGSYGLLVELDHGRGLRSRYAHLSMTTLSRGDVVVAGARVGLSGKSGRVTGPHLHFEVHLDEKPLDPLALLGWRARSQP